MPIRINLLAEQQAAEEARRRDPLKRSIWLGVFVVLLVLLWSGYTQFQVSRAKSALAGEEAHWKHLQSQFLQVSNNFREAGSARQQLSALQKYSSNRFLWTHPLNALQHAAVDKVRLVTVIGSCTMTEQKEMPASTNFIVNGTLMSWWQWWHTPIKTNVQDAAYAMLGAITNRPDLARYQSILLANLSIITNRSSNPNQIITKIDVVKPETVTEKIKLTLKARDYQRPSGGSVDRFYAGLTNSPLFRQFLGKTNALVQPEVLAKEDQTDLINPNDLFIPFTIECLFPERVRIND